MNVLILALLAGGIYLVIRRGGSKTVSGSKTVVNGRRVQLPESAFDRNNIFRQEEGQEIVQVGGTSLTTSAASQHITTALQQPGPAGFSVLINREVAGIAPGTGLLASAQILQRTLGFPVEYAAAYFDAQERAQLIAARSSGLLPPPGPSGAEQDQAEIERLMAILGISSEEATKRVIG